MKNREFRTDWSRGLGFLTLIATELVALTLAGIGIGYWAHTSLSWPFWTMVFTGLVGFGFAIYRIYLWTERERSRKQTAEKVKSE